MNLPRERWLQTIWGRTDWSSWELHTSTGERLHIISPGQWNSDQGPDFLGAQLFIGQVFWVGAVELHVQSSDWFLHQHTHDPNYRSVILHVVWKLDAKHPNLPTLELSLFLSKHSLRTYFGQLTDIGLLVCRRVMRPVQPECWQDLRRGLLRQRLKRKAARFSLHRPVLRSVLARQMGAWVNRDIFESIDASIPDQVFEATRSDLSLITALYLGQGGLLNESAENDYLRYLFLLYRQIRKACGINPPYKQLLWMRIRPAANPLIRLTQLAALVHAGWSDIDSWKETDAACLRHRLIMTSGSADRYALRNREEKMTDSPQFISEGVAEGLLINIWAYLDVEDPDVLIDRLRVFAFEDNRITRMYAGLGIITVTASDSQAMMELYHDLCQQQRCRSCRLAHSWIQDQAPQSI